MGTSGKTTKMIGPTVRFLGEQDGAAERALKEKLSESHARQGDVKRAYLAIVAYDDPNVYHVAVCLRALRGEDPAVVKAIGAIFSSMFGPHEHLDILFLSDDQEIELTKVCTPYYRAGTH